VCVCGQDIHRFLPNIVADNGDFNIVYYQINSLYLLTNTISWMSIFILSLSYSQVLQLLRFLTQHSVEHISSTQAHIYQFTFSTNVN